MFPKTTRSPKPEAPTTPEPSPLQVAQAHEQACSERLSALIKSRSEWRSRANEAAGRLLNADDNNNKVYRDAVTEHHFTLGAVGDLTGKVADAATELDAARHATVAAAKARVEDARRLTRAEARQAKPEDIERELTAGIETFLRDFVAPRIVKLGVAAPEKTALPASFKVALGMREAAYSYRVNVTASTDEGPITISGDVRLEEK